MKGKIDTFLQKKENELEKNVAICNQNQAQAKMLIVTDHNFQPDFYDDQIFKSLKCEENLEFT